ncbi:hypothetical protein GE061_014208 [Apolygus lucorum]|uniref:NF-X1-type domain-containing protein n=1 Tax=Apolygus lucorum TaxID=248454 RepID=A0A8S9XR44_APOLU|nr:hypothetical protein GE061_014208 [Apolygus lucorum]
MKVNLYSSQEKSLVYHRAFVNRVVNSMSPRRTDSTKPPGKLKMGLNHSKKAKKPVSCEPVSPSSSNENGDPMGASKHYENINRPRFPFAPEDVTISMSDTSSSKSSGGFLLSENLSILTPHLIIEQSSRLLKNAESANTPDESENSPNLQSTSGVSSITPSPVDFDSTDDDSVSGESCAGSISESILGSEVSTSGELSNEDSRSDSETSVRPSEIIILKKEENAAESVPNDSSVPPKPPVLTFYIPRESTIPKTSDAKKQSLTPFQRINMKTKSKLLSNIKAGYHISQWKKLEKLWDSIYNLKKVNQWKALKSLDNPVLINLKLVQVKYSFVEVVSKVSDFDSCFALFDVLSAASLSKFESHKTEVFMEVATPRFMKTLLAVVESFHSQRPASHKLKSFIENLVDIYGDIFLQLDSLATDGLAEDLIKVIESCLKSVSTQIQDDFFAEHLNRLLFIVNSRDSLIRGNSCFPYDILREESVEENIIDGPYDNFDHYLSIHYRLLKEDFQNSLREGIVKYLQTLYGKRRRTINHHLTIYPNVTLACQLTKYLVKYKIIFHDSAVIRRLQDSATRAFLSGALLLLTPCVSPSNPQPFKEYYLVRVEDSSPLERELTYIFVSMILGPHNPIESMKVLMVEPRQLFEPYHRVMNVIRSLDTNHFPFIRYIVDIKTDVLPPAYMEPTTKLRLGNSECFLWDDETWPNPENLELNKVQLDGLKLALRMAYLLQKLDFMKYKLSELSQPLTCDVHMKMMHVRLTFASPESQPPIESLPLGKRWLLYKSWVDDLYQCHFDKMKSCTSKSRDQHLRFVEIDELVNVKKIAQCDAEVIGMTTTAAAKYYKMMDFLKPKIILVEEAAEVIEAHTVASLSKHCEHLILVGDHKQLRPLTSSYLIGKDAHLDVSMYERLVRNGFPHCTLNTQYRMRPEIASLIAPAVYPDLVNDSSVDELPHVLGVCADLYFVDHNVQEDETIETVSRWNVYEAEFLLALCIYLVRQGYQPDQITVLATYAEQESYFNKEKLNYPELDEVLMATVDSFQGKESDIVLLSLVRSNVEGNIGFLAQRNRINVALSRAKRGLFITGNSRSLLTKGGLWHEVIDVLSKNKAIGSALPLKCQIHGRITHVKTPSALRLLRNGGCSTICRALLACGHNCKHRCHPTDRSHEGIFKCSNVCKKRMSCSHSCILTCHVYNEKIKCFCESCTPKTKCEYKLPCGHTCKSMGHAEDVEHEDKFRCSEICNTALTCGHICCSLCHVEDAAHIKRYKCPIVCEGKLVCDARKCLPTVTILQCQRKEDLPTLRLTDQCPTPMKQLTTFLLNKQAYHTMFHKKIQVHHSFV